MMTTLDLSHQIVDEKGEPIKDEKGEVVPLKTVLQTALLSPTSTTQPHESKLERFELFLKLKLAEVKVELSTGEAELIKQASSLYPVLIYGQVVHWLQGKLNKDQSK